MRPCLLSFLLFILLSPAQGSAQESGSAAEVLQPFVDRNELAGAIALVADKDTVLALETVGHADLKAGKQMKPDAMFWIASQTKPMTAVAVMMLVDEGQIDLDSPVESYLPEFEGQMVVMAEDDEVQVLRKPTHPMTVREVLSHMSGLPFRSELEIPKLDGLPLPVAVRSYAMTSLDAQPGTVYRYSNAGINTAARILEVVSGTSYEDFLQQRLFDPLGMTDTTFWPNEEQVERLALTYGPNEAGDGLKEVGFGQLIMPLSDRSNRYPMPAGGLFSTARDTARFCQMMLNGGSFGDRQYLSDSAFSELTRRQTPESVDQSYGLGFAVGSDPVGPWFGHSGAHATHMEIHPERGIVMVWMVQHAGFPGEGREARSRFIEWARKFSLPQ